MAPRTRNPARSTLAGSFFFSEQMPIFAFVVYFVVYCFNVAYFAAFLALLIASVITSVVCCCTFSNRWVYVSSVVLAREWPRRPDTSLTSQPADYRLFQVTDLFCTLELTLAKIEMGLFSNSEDEFFHGSHKFKKENWRKLVKIKN